MKITHFLATVAAMTLCESLTAAEPSPSWADLYVLDLNRGVVGLTCSSFKGILIDSVEAGTPAAAAGVHKSDRIVAIDGSPTSDIENFRDVRIRMTGAPESVVDLTVMTAEGQTRIVSLKRIALGSVPRVKSRPNTLLSYSLF